MRCVDDVELWSEESEEQEERGGQGGEGARQKMPSEEDEEDERTVVAPNTGAGGSHPRARDGSGGRSEGRGTDRGRKGR